MVFKHREYTLNVCVGSLDAHFSEKKWKKYKNKCCLPQKRPYNENLLFSVDLTSL